VQCPCKINLGLTVGPRLKNRGGLHQIYSLFIPIRIGPLDHGSSHASGAYDPSNSRADFIQIRNADSFEFRSENLIQGPDAVIQAFEYVSERGPAMDKNLMVRAARLIEPFRLAAERMRDSGSDQHSEFRGPDPALPGIPSEITDTSESNGGGGPAIESEKSQSSEAIAPLSIQITKRIPPGTGVGAGSANAAAVLIFALQQGWITSDQSKQLAPELGADVSFFLENMPALVEGTGERITPIDCGPVYGVICFPGLFVSTGEAYSRLKRPLQQSEDAKLGSLLSDSDWQAIAAGEWSRLAHWTNDFEPPVFAMHPELQEIKAFMVRVGADYCSLSGSGSALYGLYSSSQGARIALDSLKSQYPELPFETFALWE